MIGTSYIESFDRSAARLATMSNISFKMAPSAAKSDVLLSNSRKMIKMRMNLEIILIFQGDGGYAGSPYWTSWPINKIAMQLYNRTRQSLRKEPSKNNSFGQAYKRPSIFRAKHERPKRSWWNGQAIAGKKIKTIVQKSQATHPTK